MIPPGYMPSLQMCLVVGLYTSSLKIADVFGSSFASVYMHLFGLLWIETSSSTKSALWEAPLCVCFSVFLYFMSGKLSMFIAATLGSFMIFVEEHYDRSDGYDYPPSAYRLKGDGDDGDYDYAPAASDINGDDDDGDYDYALAA
nr:hypothetical protein [Tanacetum cinerariifolium]